MNCWKSLLLTAALLGLLCVGVVEAENISLRIGAMLPLSGRLAHVGKDVRRGLEMAVQDLSKSAVKFELVFEDNQHNAIQAASVARKLLDQDKVDVIISLWDMADVVAPIAERKKVAHLAIRWDPEVAERYRFTQTIESSYRSYIESQFQLLNILGKKKVGILTEEAQGWILGSDYFKKRSADAGITVVGEEKVASGSLDSRSAITRLLSKQPDIVVIYSNSPVTELLIKELRALSPRQLFTGYFEVLTQPRIVEGVPFVAQFEAAPWFEEEYRKRYGEPFSSRAPHAYDIISLIALAESHHGHKIVGEKLLQAIGSLGTLPGASGFLEMSRPKVIENKCVWRIVKDDRFQPLQMADLF